MPMVCICPEYLGILTNVFFITSSDVQEKCIFKKLNINVSVLCSIKGYEVTESLFCLRVSTSTLATSHLHQWPFYTLSMHP